MKTETQVYVLVNHYGNYREDSVEIILGVYSNLEDVERAKARNEIRYEVEKRSDPYCELQWFDIEQVRAVLQFQN